MYPYHHRQFFIFWHGGPNVEMQAVLAGWVRWSKKERILRILFLHAGRSKSGSVPHTRPAVCGFSVSPTSGTYGRLSEGNMLEYGDLSGPIRNDPQEFSLGGRDLD